MVFTSIPVYLDPPNWQQQIPNNNQQGIGIDQQQQQQLQQQQQQHHSQNHSQLIQPPLQLQTAAPVGGTGGVGASSIRPGSMADRARQAKLPQPEQQLKCPRCDSSNTKFCYFNNYSLTQPRHFCKTCRRYWTRGGALRNVPVGGGCRRNKRSKSTSSKSPGNSEQRQSHSSTTSSSIPSNSTNLNTNDNNLFSHHMMSTTPQSQPRPQIPFMSSLHHFTDHYGSAPGLGLNFSGIQTPSSGQHGGAMGTIMDFQMGNSSSGGSANILSSTGGIEQWRLQQMQQFPFLGGLEPPQSGMYPYQGVVENMSQIMRTGRPTGSLASSVKMEENQAAGLNLSRQFMGDTTNANSNSNSQGNDNQYNWGSGGGGGAGTAAWTDLSGFTSSSTTHLV
ncbi:hypothetical protein C5167_000096 [Papaver somniferum]|uniref:Dof zinc finger protein n=1 Tax=Papaver somniferum TaxID=3469 RepID=A0A4Y7KUW8_PAPSO|nr:dof zinc finger protein DOF2.4-like [Papaver somniferum]RZC75729.1 hypothetical protein C5167_000096 [Papaver somniferum]